MRQLVFCSTMMKCPVAALSAAFTTCAFAALLSAALPMPASPTQSAPRNIALLHMYDAVPFFQRLGALTAQNKRRYAHRHGYHFVEYSPHITSGLWQTHFDIDHSRAPTFGKIKLALAACERRADFWLLWSDADAMVLNQSVPLESIIDDAYDMMITYDWLMMNAGVLLLRCSEWTKTFLRTVYDARQFDSARALDQSSIQEHLDNLTEAERNEHIKVVPKHALNVYLEEYRAGDFLVHMAGKLYEATEQGLFAIANQLDVLSMVDDIEDVKAFFRSTAFLNYYSGVCAVKYGERQSSCKPGDARRIFLNESLGSMSYPNRYRHVGLRYYWLRDWKDKYDVEGWNVKKKTFVRTVAKHMPPKGQQAQEEERARVANEQLAHEQMVRQQLALLEDGGTRSEADGATWKAEQRGERNEAAGAEAVGSGGGAAQGKRARQDGAALFWLRGLTALAVGAAVAAMAGARRWRRHKLGSKTQ
eukprot:TRINITY_DN76_c0_g1_i1.p2 TRINITY_DN76_c0_g1~~TRINITY_DN76_c0_g1_i1.p2  ORF type:complete len:476 (+),score=90.83 TRINITY_DN76_c0_g1_i1:3567-4994(+)